MEKNVKTLKKLFICSGIICAAIIVDYFIQKYMYKTRYAIVKEDFSYVFQIDSLECVESELVLTGWVFELGENAIEEDFEIVLYDYSNDKRYRLNVSDTIRKDVNDYFMCEYDYSKSGFVASYEIDELDLENTNYEVLIRPSDEGRAYKSGTYISKGNIMYTEPEGYVPLKVSGTDIEEIVNKGVLRVYRPDVGMYVYQYDKMFYWIADDNYKFNEDENTKIRYLLYTTQINRLPQNRLEKNKTNDDRGMYFEKKELTNFQVGNYRVMALHIPQEYSITKITTGYYEDKWVWKQYFRPWYEFE